MEAITTSTEAVRACWKFHGSRVRLGGNALRHSQNDSEPDPKQAQTTIIQVAISPTKYRNIFIEPGTARPG